MGVSWTTEQRQAIELDKRNILVSAAAGSGKTAVLVERMIQKLLREVDPVDVNRLLIVTYTDAAAAEMKERIRNAIEKQVEQFPDNENLLRQATLIHSAQVTTIHSFCQSVIRENFHVIDLDPGFRVAEDGELKLLKKEVMDELLEERYAKGDSDFRRFAAAYGGKKNDNNIEELVLKLYAFSRSYPMPEAWLQSCVNAYDIQTEEEFEQSIYYKKALQNVISNLEDIKHSLERAHSICLEPEGPFIYEEMLVCDIRAVEAVMKMKDYQSLSVALDSKSVFGSLPRCSKKDAAAEKINRVQEIRKAAKASVEKLRKTFFAQPIAGVLEDLQVCRPVVQELVDLTCDFSKAYEEKKRSKNLIDFDDMQLYALRILTEEVDGELIPSPIAREYQEQYDEVVIDEYQDSNLIQETILGSVSRQSVGENNVFMVGDVKQSIYRFRLSRPELFMEKYRNYSIEESDTQRIDLHHNFRSRAEVLNSVNEIFYQIMHENLGGIEYDEQAALHVGASYIPNEGCKTELILVPEEKVEIDDEELSGIAQEAYVVAGRIRKLMEEQQVVDKQTGELRDLQYRDIVILMRSKNNYANIFSKVLMEQGIPVYSGAMDGYFGTQEIGLIMDYLRLLNNRCQDIPLAAVLKSVFGNFTEEELAFIKGEFREEPFYRAVLRYSEEGQREDVKKKLNSCLSVVERFRERMKYEPLHVLLEQIMDETGYEDYVAALPGGEQRVANLHMLIEKAKSFESSSYQGVFQFVRYVEQLVKYEVDYGEAGIIDELADSVRIMSIHKSKGLEFPVVFVSTIGKRFNRRDLTDCVLVHASLGMGVECIRMEEHTKIPSFIKQVIKNEELLESQGEELRILYVALTRAKEKLIITGTAKNLEKMVDHPGEVTYGTLVKAMNYMQWLVPAVWNSTSGLIDSSIVDMSSVQVENLEESIQEAKTREALENWDTEQTYDSEMKEVLEEQFQYEYPYKKLDVVKQKYSVSDLKQKDYNPVEDGEPLTKDAKHTVPAFLKEEERLSGASRGSAYHRVLELLDFTKDYNDVELKEAISCMTESGRITREMAGCIYRSDILHFLESDAGMRMRATAKRGQLKKEQPFVLGVPMSEVDLKDLDPEAVQDEWVLIQGIIDVWFEEEEGIVVLDYKTDRVKEGQELFDHYHRQLEYYGEALNRITEKPVKEKIIYSFTLEKEIKWS